MDLIDRQDAIRIVDGIDTWQAGWRGDAIESLKALPSAQPERTKYIQDTKAVPSDRDCVDLSEKVTATFYDDEHEEWSQRTVTIRDVLDSVCDSYTVIEPERKTGRWIPCSERLPELDEDGYSDKVLVCFSNFTGCEVCEYRECDDCHGWYVGDSDDNPEDVGVHVIAWMPIPEPYKEGE